MIEIPGEVWDEEAARHWWETHLPDSCNWRDLTSDSLTLHPGVGAQREPVWIIPMRSQELVREANP